MNSLRGMKYKRKRVKICCSLLLIFLTILSTVGCGAKTDAMEYVSGSLDAAYKASYDTYMKVTGCEKKEAQKLHKRRLKECMSYVENANISEELQGKYRELFEDFLKSAFYSVDSVKKKNGEYLVSIKVNPYNMFSDIEEELGQAVDAYYEEVTASAAASGTPLPNDQEAREKVYELLFQILEEHGAHITYGEEKVVTIRVKKTDFKNFVIEKEDLQKLDNVLLDMTAMGF